MQQRYGRQTSVPTLQYSLRRTTCLCAELDLPTSRQTRLKLNSVLHGEIGGRSTSTWGRSSWTGRIPQSSIAVGGLLRTEDLECECETRRQRR